MLATPTAGKRGRGHRRPRGTGCGKPARRPGATTRLRKCAPLRGRSQVGSEAWRRARWRGRSRQDGAMTGTTCSTSHASRETVLVSFRRKSIDLSAVCQTAPWEEYPKPFSKDRPSQFVTLRSHQRRSLGGRDEHSLSPGCSTTARQRAKVHAPGGRHPRQANAAMAPTA